METPETPLLLTCSIWNSYEERVLYTVSFGIIFLIGLIYTIAGAVNGLIDIVDHIKKAVESKRPKDLEMMNEDRDQILE